MATQTPPADPAAPSGDFLSSIRQEIIALGHKGIQEPSPEAAGPSPLAAAPSSLAAGSPPAAPDAPAASPEPPAEAAASQPAQDPAGSPPADVSTPAPSSDVTSDPDYQRALQMAGGDPVKLAKRFLEINNRNAELARQLKAAGTPAATPTGQAIEPAAQPTVTPTEPTPPEPPANAAPTDPQAAVQQFVAADSECSAYVAEWQKNTTRIEALDTTELPNLRQQIAVAEALLKRTDVDELTKEAVTAELARNQGTLDRLSLERDRLDLKNEGLDTKYRKKVQSYRERVAATVTAQAREAERHAAIDREADGFAQEWQAAFEKAFSEGHFPADMRDEVHESVIALARATPGRINATAFVNAAVAKERAKLDKYHRAQARIYATQKTADTDAPPPSATPAAPADPSTTDPEKVTRLMLRQAMSARRAG